ncbi:shikimate dehydrogenase [Methylomonas sp. AM2-LC]|uniref:shikimate dehydrogenase n=1 Tax=Methylomonas sp. AM2-LC TaxID=3153301 RepID=UPI003267C2FB
MNTIDRYAVFGQPINHSKSPRIHSLFAEQTGQSMQYVAQEVSSAAFDTTVKRFFDENGKGLNCTVPLKELAWQYADSLTERARQAKAVNTLSRQADGSILGDNTDGIGLVNDLTLNHPLNLAGKRILILGAGGASRGIIAPLLALLPDQITIANRTISKAEAMILEFADLGCLQSTDYAKLTGQSFDLIINATSASLSGELPPLPPNLLATAGSCYDLAYANQPTAFVRWGHAQNALHSLDGLGMLVEQAAQAFFVWRGILPHTAPIIALLDSERKAN